MSTAVEPFKFNFSTASNASDTQNEKDSIPPADQTGTEPEQAAAACVEVSINDARAEECELQFEEVTVDGNVTLLKGTISSTAAANALNLDDVLESDLVPGRYEGGFKLWEGATDLCNYLCTTFNINESIILDEEVPENLFKGKMVLELGCGHGLPGILALLAGAEVHFQDYNQDVLTQLTIPNVLANQKRLPQSRSRGTARFFSGDWKSFGEMMANLGLGGHYDYIFTAETIYSLDSQPRLLECMKQVVQPPQGEIFIAAKSYYFGVGGGVKSFSKLIRSDGLLESKRVWKAEEENNTTREILKLKFPDSIYPYFL